MLGDGDVGRTTRVRRRICAFRLCDKLTDGSGLPCGSSSPGRKRIETASIRWRMGTCASGAPLGFLGGGWRYGRLEACTACSSWERKVARNPLKLALPKGFTGQFRTKPFWITGQVVLSRLDCAEGTILENNGVVGSQDQFLFRSHLLSPDSNPSKLVSLSLLTFSLENAFSPLRSRRECRN